jgi:hypothetical protein
MMMEETEKILSPDDPDETLVTPRFDADEAVLARPVVPLDVAEEAAPGAALAAPYAPQPGASRRSWALALVLVSALAGGLLGGAGLYLYQKRQPSQATPAPARAAATAEAAQPAPAPTTEALNEPQAPTTPPHDSASAASASKDVNPAVSEEVKTPASHAANGGAETGAKREPEKKPAAEQRRASVEDEAAAAPRHSKKDADDKGDAPMQSERRPRRVIEDTQGPIPDDSSPAAIRAARVEAALRRAARVRAGQRNRRGDSARSVDSIHGIFEGRP